MANLVSYVVYSSLTLSILLSAFSMVMNFKTYRKSQSKMAFIASFMALSYLLLNIYMSLGYYALMNMVTIAEPFHSLAIIIMTGANQVAVIAPLLLVFHFFLNEVPGEVKVVMTFLGIANAFVHILFGIHADSPHYFSFLCQLCPLLAYLISCISAIFLYKNEKYDTKKIVAKPFWLITMITLPAIAAIGFVPLPKETYWLWLIWTIRPLFYALMATLFVKFRQELCDLFPKKKKKKKFDLPSFASRFELTVREQELTSLLVKGFKNREMGNLMGVKEKSVENHLTRIYRKCDVGSRVELMHLTMTYEEQ